MTAGEERTKPTEENDPFAVALFFAGSGPTYPQVAGRSHRGGTAECSRPETGRHVLGQERAKPGPLAWIEDLVEPGQKGPRLLEHAPSGGGVGILQDTYALQRGERARAAEHPVSLDAAVRAPPHQFHESFADLGTKKLVGADVGADDGGATALANARSDAALGVSFELNGLVERGVSREP